MKGIPVTKEEKRLHDIIAALGCIACRQEGIRNTHVSIHHVHGRTRANCHMHVLPLCGPHHQDDGTALAVHPWKKRWEKRYGKQDDLVKAQWDSLGVSYGPIGKKEPKLEKDNFLVEGSRLKAVIPKKTGTKPESTMKKGSFASSPGRFPKGSSLGAEKTSGDKKNTIKQRIPSKALTSKTSPSKLKQTFPKAKQSFPKVKQSFPKLEMTEEQKKIQSDLQKDLRERQKAAQIDLREKYESENKDKIEAQKQQARDYQREKRREMAAKAKEHRKAQKK